jgi:phospholipase/carboxylesterase
MTLEYLIREPKINSEVSKVNPPLLIMLHGYGSNDADLFSFADQLPENLLIISARAPISMGFGAFSWYTINFDDANGKFSNLDEARDSIKKIELFIDEISTKYQVDKQNIFLLGFSQGCILSYAIALKNANKIKHVIALSGYINTKLIPSNLKKDSFNNLDFYISHGTVDQVLPVDWARKSIPILETLNIKFDYKEYPIGHGVSPQNFADFNQWITERV